MNLGEHIYHLRTEKGMSQGDLAEALDVSRQSVSKWETGGAIPDLEKLIKMSDLFGLTLDQLVKGEAAAEQESTAEPQVIYIEKQNTLWPQRKIVGTVLFGLALLVVLLCTILGGLLEGLVLSIPLLACGTVCFVFQKRVGLWCSWAVFFLLDLFLKFAIGYGSGGLRSILHFISLGHQGYLPWPGVLTSVGMSLVLVLLVVLTIRSYRGKVISDNNAARRSLVLLGLLLLCEAIPWGISYFASTLPHDSWLIYWRGQTLIYFLLHWLRIVLFQRLLIDLLAIRRWKKAQQ